MALKIEKIKQKQASKRHQLKRTHRGPLVIACNRKEFNHHKGQTYSDFSPRNLASGGWKHVKSKGDHFTIQALQGVIYQHHFKICFAILV